MSYPSLIRNVMLRRAVIVTVSPFIMLAWTILIVTLWLGAALLSMIVVLFLSYFEVVKSARRVWRDQ